MPMCPPPSSREVEFTSDVVRTGQVSTYVHCTLHVHTSLHVHRTLHVYPSTHILYVYTSIELSALVMLGTSTEYVHSLYSYITLEGVG